MEVTLYTIGCQNCIQLEKMLNEHNIKFSTVTDKQAMINKGFEEVPMLDVDGNIMNYYDARKWVTDYEKQ